jgi:hypothetical protein
MDPAAELLSRSRAQEQDYVPAIIGVPAYVNLGHLL